MKPETGRWLRKADGHLKMARIAIEAGYSEHGVFWCEQALEVLLKALQVESRSSSRPRRTHDLVDLAKDSSLPFSEDDLGFLRRLGEQYTLTRYADEDVDYPQERAVEYLQKAEVLFSWLRQGLS